MKGEREIKRENEREKKKNDQKNVPSASAVSLAIVEFSSIIVGTISVFTWEQVAHL